MNAIKASVDKDIPVLAWGMGGVTTRTGNRWDPLPEGCLIGGYDENDMLYVNLYLGEERLPESSLTRIKHKYKHIRIFIYRFTVFICRMGGCDKFFDFIVCKYFKAVRFAFFII